MAVLSFLHPQQFNIPYHINDEYEKVVAKTILIKNPKNKMKYEAGDTFQMNKKWVVSMNKHEMLEYKIHMLFSIINSQFVFFFYSLKKQTKQRSCLFKK